MNTSSQKRHGDKYVTWKNTSNYNGMEESLLNIEKDDFLLSDNFLIFF